MPAIWKTLLEKQLKKANGNKKGAQLTKKYADSFPAGYQDEYSIIKVIDDINIIEKLSTDNPLEISLYYTSNSSSDKGETSLHLRLFQYEIPIPLSDILPILENMDLRTMNECPYDLIVQKKSIYISDFRVTYVKSKGLELNKIKQLFSDTLIQIYLKQVESDGFNKLVLGASLAWREIMILRAYAKYLRQVGFRFSQRYIEQTLANHPLIARNLVQLFFALHNPHKKAAHKKMGAQIEKQIRQALEAVTSLDEDKIIRRYLDIIKATLRTNYFQLTSQKQHKAYLSIKLSSRAIPELPLPVPLYEVFVYSARFEAIHLRNTKVARGGIRWSDRREDFRTEILGLMKAQTVKNAVIIPSGAKGGFVLKTLPPQATREVVQKEVIECYQSFMRGLLDITDNIKNRKIIRPPQTVYYDGEDPYLVVAADKGTAAFSDIANAISKEYHFWLGDAFASGGITGYDHKKIGITARGAWESVKRHFRELELDITKTNITVVGIGDMSGDVFGNGMIYSKHIKLLAAFDHRHIFIDPNPDPLKSYAERVRLFKLPTSSWENYNARLLSKGGGIYSRTLKSITLSSEIKKWLSINDSTLTPTDLIRAILSAPVDLLWNGGIGTYVKSSTQSNADVGDRTNDFCRVNGNELHCKVVGEGGNLGFTQLGRIEYALTGGLINTDFIDNSAGVDCSDHEVNLKILLNEDVAKGTLSETKRNQVLASVTQEVANLVLSDNFQQAMVMSIAAFSSKDNISIHQTHIKELEALGELNRPVEFLPDDKTILERKAAGLGLTRPEIAVLLAYTKIHIKHEILNSDLPEDPFLSAIVETAFPPALCKRFRKEMQNHSLRRDIIATQLSNRIVNEMGITFVHRIQAETGATVANIIRAQVISSHVYESYGLMCAVIELDFKIPMEKQYDLINKIRQLINLSTRWFLHNNRLKPGLAATISHYAPRIKTLHDWVPTLMGGLSRDYLEETTTQFINAGLTKEFARNVATYRPMYTALNIIEVATKRNLDLVKTAKIYFTLGDQFNLIWFRDQISADTREGHWNTLARLTLRDELDSIQRTLTMVVMEKNSKQASTNYLIENWLTINEPVIVRWNTILAMLHSSTIVDYSMFFIALRELMALIQIK